jgi:hypothetical protein
MLQVDPIQSFLNLKIGLPPGTEFRGLPVINRNPFNFFFDKTDINADCRNLFENKFNNLVVVYFWVFLIPI